MDPDPDAGLRGDDASRADSRRGAHDDYSFLGPEHLSSSLPAPLSTASHAAASATARPAIDPLNPDGFYKSYRALHLGADAVPRPMAPSPLRSSADGAPRPPANHASPRSSGVRSASGPVGRKTSPSGASRTPTDKPSVKDLKKRFDHNGGASSIPRASLRPGATPPWTAYSTVSAVKAGNGTAASSALRGSPQDSPVHGGRESASMPRAAQRPKFVVPDAASINSQSFASRIGRPRSSANGKSVASKSMTQLSHRVTPRQPQQRPSSPPTLSPRSHGLLFGEILPHQRDATSTVGFGIEAVPVPPPTTSESGCYDSAASHRCSFSDPDAEPPSPTSWYRDADTQHHDESQDPSGRTSLHARSHSDAVASSSSSTTSCRPLTKKSTSASFGQSSKLPVSVRKPCSPASSTSPASSRSNSPSTLKCSQQIPRVSAAGPAPCMATTPVTRSKTPTQIATGRKPPPQALVTPNNSTRLQAYIAAPPPRKSPPLRSSRPRQPVSAAATTGLRMKDTDRARSRDRPHLDRLSRVDAGMARRRKISVGPIDFEQRREHIRLAYSKSIRENQAIEARQKAADRRRQEMEAASKAYLSAEAAVSVNAAVSTPSASGAGPTEEAQADSKGHEASTLSPAQEEPDVAVTPSARDPADPLAQSPVPPLSISTSLSGAAGPSDEAVESPTLGVPGSFPELSPRPADEQPPSAVSVASETTEFDAEPQTNPPIQEHSPPDIPITIIKPPSPLRLALAHPRAEYQYPFEDEADSPEQPPPRSETVEEPAQAATRCDGNEPRIPGAFADELEELDPAHDVHSSPHGTTVTILPPTREEVLDSDAGAQTVPFPRLDAQDESDCHSELNNSQPRDLDVRRDDAPTDSCTEEADDHDRIGLRRAEFSLGDQPSHRTSTCASSSDAGVPDDGHYSAHDQPRSTANSSSPRVSPPRPQIDRLSQQSAWTDFTVDTTDPSDAARSAMQSRHELPSFGHATIFEPRTPARESVSRDAGRDKPDVRGADDPSSLSTHLGQPQLPEVDTGDGFFVPYLSPGASASLSYLPSPDHEPPPIPNSVSGSALNSRTSSIFYERSHYGSTHVNSEGESGEYLPQIETPRSTDTTSIETADQYVTSRTPADADAKSLAREGDEPTGKERHRLVQRCNVIKELVDTEAVFVRDMNIVEEIYKGTAEACPKLDYKTVKLIFRNSDEIIEFHTLFLKQLKKAAAPVYVPPGSLSYLQREDSVASSHRSHGSPGDPNDAKDRATLLGPVFQRNMEKMKLAHEGFLRNSDQAAKRLIQIQQDPTVKVWLNECNEVAKDLTAAWDLDSLLIKPMQRITKYPNLIITLLQHTPQDHPDREALTAAKDSLETAIIEINKTKKNFELVGQIVGRKRKESDVKVGLARAFGKRVDKLQASSNRPDEDPDYVKLNEKFGDDYLRLQVVLRDVEFYTRQVSAYVHEFLQYLSSIELVMRLQPGNYPELESKWVQFNISVRDLEKVALEEHLAQVRKHVIEPFELVIKAYGNPSLAMKKRQKRRLDYERSEQLKRAGKTVDPKLRELVEQYEALNDTLKKELPVLSSLTEKVGNICLGNLVNIQVDWYAIWKDKMRTVLGDCPEMPELKEVVSTFQRDYPYAHDQLASIGILNPAAWGRISQSATTLSMDDSTMTRTRQRTSDADTRGRGNSVNGDAAPTLPAPDFGKRRSGSFTMSPSPSGTGFGSGPAPSPHHYYYRDYYSGIYGTQQQQQQQQQQQLLLQQLQAGGGPISPKSPEIAGSSRSFVGTGAASTRPSTGRSFDSGVLPRQSSESANQLRRDSNTTYNSSYPTQESRRYSNIFHSALPLPDGPEESRRSSRASSRERMHEWDGYNVLWLAASLFEFNISTTKHEAGYPYLTYQAGEIFDVIAEKGELWLAKNQDDPTDEVGWIWSKHFAKLADS